VSKSSLLFGNPVHIDLARKPRKKSKTSEKSATRKKATERELLVCECCCGWRREQTPTNEPKGVSGLQGTLWELIETTGQAA
jgi:hypothetical protein